MDEHKTETCAAEAKLKRGFIFGRDDVIYVQRSSARSNSMMYNKTSLIKLEFKRLYAKSLQCRERYSVSKKSLGKSTSINVCFSANSPQAGRFKSREVLCLPSAV